jgi:hypothetical protein
VSLFEISGLFAAGLCSIVLLNFVLARKLRSKTAPPPTKLKPPKKVPERYERFAEAFAMTYSPAWDGNAFLKGFVGAVSVELVSHGRALGLVVAPPGLPWSWFTEAHGESPPIVFGIPRLDSILHFSGDEAQLVAALDGPTRQLYLECDCTFTRGKLTHEANHSVFSDRASERTLIERAQKMAALGAALAQAPLPAKLANNAAADPLPDVRLLNLQILAAKFVDSEEARRAFRAGLADADSQVRTYAAGQDPSPAAMAVLLATIGDGNALPDTRATAFGRLRARSNSIELQPLILKLLAEATTLPTSLTCAVIAAAQPADQADLLAVCGLDSANEPSLATAMAQWLARAQEPLAEETLMKLSQLHPSDREARTAIATSLGAIGSARAVSALLPMTKGLIHNESHQAAKSAIRQIQSRLGHVEAGWISVAPIAEQAGAVSVAPEGGEVSLAPANKVKE